MKRKTKEQIVDITLAVLEGILRIGEGTMNAFVDQRSLYKTKNCEDFASWQITNRLRELIMGGYIEVKEESGTTSVRLTRKGKIKHLEKTVNKEIDGKWRFISFDIPEKLRTQRIKLTRSLRRIGYKALQKSLWVCPFIRADEVELIIEQLKLQQYTAYFVVEKTDIKEHLEGLFPEIFE